jgi:hypothetical protein
MVPSTVSASFSAMLRQEGGIPAGLFSNATVRLGL